MHPGRARVPAQSVSGPDRSIPAQVTRSTRPMNHEHLLTSACTGHGGE